jgi:hypothetical protein
VIGFNVVLWVDSIITIGIIVSNDFNRDSFNIVTIPSTFASSDIKWTHTVSITIFWTVFSSPSIFAFNNTGVEFTSINGFITIFITFVNKDSIVRLFNIVTKIDLSIIVGIIVGDNFNRDVIDIFTIPSSWASSTFVWGGTIDVFGFWTVFSSPFIFTFNNTFEDFTSIEGGVIILVTIFN